MDNLYIYGAGMLGEKICHLLQTGGHPIAGFIDTYKRGDISVGGKLYRIFSLEELNDCKNITVVISVLDSLAREEITKKLCVRDTPYKTVEDILYPELPPVGRNRRLVADYHIEEMDDYFEKAESESALNVFWGAQSPFREMFDRLDLTSVVELACGHGRHVVMYQDRAEEITLVDILEKNISICRKRYEERAKIGFYVNNGKDLREIADASKTALFTYDSMVHFELMDIYSYLLETKRILKTGGMALLHHSNNTEDYRINFATGKYGRNYMSAEIFAYLAHRVGVEVVEQHLVDWGECKDLDCITLVCVK